LLNQIIEQDPADPRFANRMQQPGCEIVLSAYLAIMKTLSLSICLLLVFTTYAYCQSWRSELYPANWLPPSDKAFYTDPMIQDFSFAGYHRGELPINNKRPVIIDVTKAPYNADNSGHKDVTAIIQAAIDAAERHEGGAVVFLPGGIYRLSVTDTSRQALLIRKSGVIIRGAGNTKTFILNTSTTMRGKSIIAVRGTGAWQAEGKSKTLVTKDLMTPTVVIPVSDVSQYKVGDIIMLRNYVDNDWIDKHKMIAYWKDKGAQLGGLQYCREVVRINSRTSELVIDIPTRYAMERQHNTAVYQIDGMISEIGVEDLSVGNLQINTPGDWREEAYTKPENPSYQAHDSWAISMSGVYNSWVTHVASYHPKENTSGAHILSNGIRVSQSKNVSLIDCKFGSPQFGGGGGNGYMYRIMSNETLVQNCVADFNRHGFVLSGMQASGNVFYKCIDRNSGLQTGITGDEKTNGSGSDHHMHFSQSNLFDQCQVENSFFAAGWRRWGGSAIHGVTGAHSVYWNLTSNGSQAEAVQTQQARYGYVIGTQGSKPNVKTGPWAPGTDSITAPVDFTEGPGRGAGLVPQSLYIDQLRRRLETNRTRRKTAG
jgi:hypothetical protein